uniref:Uncharacterized protein n=1 Tax=Chenopodium quinoa TaxID=63459 RepID=A0A803KUX9_CHEQI
MVASGISLFVSEDFIPVQSTPASGIELSGNGFRDFGDWIAPRGLWHTMSDQELLWRASMVPHIKDYPYNRTPKVAFMFLTRKTLPLAPLWELFFKGHQGLYSIYLHTSSESIEEHVEPSVFYQRRIPSKPVEWGRATMVDAERRLLANALLDFLTIYDYLIKSKHSFVGSFDDPRKVGRGRYNKRMAPAIQLSDWRKGNQWFELNRDLGIAVVSDEAFYPVFRDHCRPPCYIDEHYLATLVVKIGKDSNSNRSITWVDWSKPGSHPTTFVRKDVSE